MSAASFSAPVAASSYVGLKPNSSKLFQVKDLVVWNRKTVSNGSKTHCMKLGYVYRENSRIPNYYDGRYWTLWKLPMFGCTDASQVLHEIQECKKTYPNAYIRCLAFDNIKQVQCMSFVIQKPTNT